MSPAYKDSSNRRGGESTDKCQSICVYVYLKYTKLKPDNSTKKKFQTKTCPFLIFLMLSNITWISIPPCGHCYYCRYLATAHENE